MLLFLYAQNELSYDKVHGENIYRIISKLSQKDGEIFNIATSSVPIAYTIVDEIPEIEHTARATSSTMFGGKNAISHLEKSLYIENGYIADTSIFSILKFGIIKGNKEKPLPHHNGIVLEKSWATTLFGEEDPIGKQVKISTSFGLAELEVTAVYDKDRNLSHLEPNFIISMAGNLWNQFFNQDLTNWVGNNMVYTYIKLHPDAQAENVNELIHDVFVKYGSEDMKAMGVSKTMSLQPVTEIHTDTGLMINIPNTTSLTFIYVLVSIGIIILVLACVNYINLSTARAGKRALEVGIRKVLGVSGWSLVRQFLAESIVIIIISLMLSILLLQIAIPYFNDLINNPVKLDSQSIPQLAMYLVGFLVITGIIAGLYPAIYQASFKPQIVLKGRGKDRKENSLLRKSLVVFQFIITICLISSIIIISQQVDYIGNKELGFDSESKIILPLPSSESNEKYETLKNEFSRLSPVKKISGANSIPGSPISNDLLVYKDGQNMEDAIHIYNNTVDLEFVQLLGIELLSGTFFKSYKKDSTIDQILISKKGVEMLNIEVDDAPGQLIYFDWEGRKFTYEILGVVDDIHQYSLHQTIDPMMYTIGTGSEYGYMIIEANMDDFQSLIASLQNGWKAQILNSPFEYFTLDKHLMLQYQSDLKTFSLIKYFALISIVLSCLGLYAMSLFTAENRFQEIGIRKTFGAGTGQILKMVSMDLTKLIAIAFVLSIPLTWYGMNHWLETFAYRITPGVGTFLLGGFLSFVVGWATISYHSVKASLTNPVDVLKDE
jgi:putative ABC transport system permease protein